MRGAPRARRRGGHALRVRVAAVVVLGGYLAVLGATTTGHGLRLALHLIAEHHEAHEHDEPEADHHDDDHHDPDEDHHDHDADHDDTPHAHRGRVHTHHEEPPPPAWLSVSLDKHVGPPDYRMPSPCPVRRAAVLCPQAPPAAVVVAVEVPPPRREA
ncbi:MAG TPA: hypothetical protein VF594_06805 [Rubricoccaceae bacterium]|jgi:hypothetical protein